ncbi:MAG: glycerophosphodiester phosphodiesterase [Ruminococcus sp.]|nr:glycerophosphodiester phosphodiesterase [Ruminococcus sp.]
MKTDLFGKYIAHRGLHGPDCPENSMCAFEQAVLAGLPIELDVRLTRDGKVAVFHDADLMRMCGVEGKISDFSYVQLTPFRLKGTGEGIPLFKDVLKQVNGRVPLLVEIKNCSFPMLEKRTARLLDCYKGEYAVQSFDPFAMLWFRLFRPETVRGLLISTHPGGRFGEYIARLITSRPWFWRLVVKPDFISVDRRTLSPSIIKAARKSGADLFVWTVRTPGQEQLVSDPAVRHLIFEDYRP